MPKAQRLKQSETNERGWPRSPIEMRRVRSARRRRLLVLVAAAVLLAALVAAVIYHVAEFN